MSNKIIQHKRSTTAGAVPTTAQVAVGELAINFADKSIYTQDGGGNIIELERDIYKAAAQPASPSQGDVWYDTVNDFMYIYDSNNNWIPLIYNGPYVTPGTTSFANTTPGGSGTSGAPYTIAATVNSGEETLVDTVTVTGLQPGQLVKIEDTNAAANGGRFFWTGNTADSSGTMVLNVYIADLPASANATVYTANLIVGSASTYIDVTATIAAVVAFPQNVNPPTNTDPATTPWTAANDTLTASNCYEISLDGITYSTGPLAITTGDTLYVKWLGAAGSGTCIDSPEGTTITGTLTASGGGVQNDTLTIDKTPNTFTFTDTTGVATSSVSASNTITLSGFNSYVDVVGSTTGTTLEYSVDGGAWTTTAPTGLVNGQTLQVRHTNSASNSTTSTASIDVGAGPTSDDFDTTTVAATPTVTTPSITAPSSSATGIGLTPTFTTSAYADANGASGVHQDTDWEIFDAAGYNGGLFDGTPVASSYNDTTNLTSWTLSTPLSASTQYYVRAKHRSTDPIDSAWSPAVDFTTAAAAMSFTLGNGNIDCSTLIWDGTQWIDKASRSTDGHTWTSHGDSNDMVWNGTDQFVKVSYSFFPAGPVVQTSPDGVTWTTVAGAFVAGAEPQTIGWNGTEYLILGRSKSFPNSPVAARTSSDGVTWTSGSTPPSAGVNTSDKYDLHWINGEWYLREIDNFGAVMGEWTSPDGATWTSVASAPSGFPNSRIAFDGVSTYVRIPTNSADFSVSTDGGTTYNTVTPTTLEGQNWEVIMWDGSQFVAGAQNTQVATSPDGINWTDQTSAAQTDTGRNEAHISCIKFNGSQHLFIDSETGDEFVMASP